ncbi:hypothetical protein D7223_07905 [Micromonospora endolithica]|uniref:Uncharacterized protein n=1 Tax=Micromonospora endolithica TaxID=230091 RepID=A0A3A9ZMW7_9ACTN|nr:hypothetical protein D7223_07905 [Micromonospora endolithica]
MSYAALIRPVVDRVYAGASLTARPAIRAYYEQRGLRPGFEVSFSFGLLARPMPAGALTDALVYTSGDMTGELDQGVATVDAEGAWHLTPLGRELALTAQRTIAEAAEERWGAAPDFLPRLADLVGRLLTHGLTTGGPAFRAVAPVYEPPDAPAALRLTARLGALRHHRADAHRAAWRAAGLTVDEIRALPDGPRRRAIEDDTNRRDEPIYAALTADERLELLAGLGALPN